MVDSSCVAEVAPTTTGSQFGWSCVYAQLMTPSSPAAATDEPPLKPLAEEPVPDEPEHAASRAAASMAAIGTTARRHLGRRLNSFTGESPRDHVTGSGVWFRASGSQLSPPYTQPTESAACVSLVSLALRQGCPAVVMNVQ